MIKKLAAWSISTLALTAGLSGVMQAQKTSGAPKKPTPQATPNDKTRSRRVATPTKAEQNPKEPAPDVITEPGDPSSRVSAGTNVKTSEGEKPTQPTSDEKIPAIKADEKKQPTPAVPPADDSIEDLRTQIEAAAEGPERIKLQLKLADTFMANGNKGEALAELNRVATSEAIDPPGFYNLGNSFARLGDAEGAVGAYRKAIEQRRGRYSKAYNNLGVVLLRMGRWDEASEAFLSALKLESFRYAEASYNLGRLYAARGDHDLAVREWRRALAVDPQHKAAAQAISGVGNESRITVAAVTPSRVDSRNSSSDRIPEPRTPTSAVSIEKPKSNTSTSLARSLRPLALDQASYDFMQRARSAAERGNLVEAVDNFRRVLSRQGGYFAPANLEISYALLTLKKYDEALPHLVQVSSREGARYPVSYFHLARLYELKGDYRLAEIAFAQAAEAYGTSNTQFLLDLSRVREKQSDFKGALEALEKYIVAMELQGMKPAWSDERLAALRSKIN
jgi:tetratricopeptide (TPR) repeat protein